MKRQLLTTLFAVLSGFTLLAQIQLRDRTTKTYQTENKIEIQGETGFLEVPENRSNPESRIVKVKYVWLKSLAEDPKAPVVYLEGAGGTVTWQADVPGELSDWVEILEVSDLIFIDRRTVDDGSLTYIWDGEFPEEFFVNERAANAHYQHMIGKALEKFEANGVDVTSYTIESHAHDVNDLMTALGIHRYTVYGFSFGSHISMTMMKLFPDRIERAILAGSDAPHQSFNYPRYLETHIDKLADLIKEDAVISQEVPDLKALIDRVMEKLEVSPAPVSVKNPITNKKMELKIGPFGLALLLRLDIDDYNDIPVIPRLLYSIDQENYDILSWFAQKRLVFALAVPADGINQQLASGAGTKRWEQIKSEAHESIFGNVVNFPFSAAKDHWVANTLSFDSSIPIQSNIPTLFITGDLDCRTPVEQVNETMKGFDDAVHVIVKNAGHEQAHWSKYVADNAIPAFLKGETITTTTVHYADLTFIPVTGKSKAHPSLR